MNREIKFRAGNKEKKEMREVNMLGLNFGRNFTCGNNDGIEVGTEDDNVIIMQYTGLHDKNGKDIWEGDVCKNGDGEENANAYNYRIEVVEYIDKEACFRGGNFNIDGMTCEVVGNIYENHDLLNK